LRAQVTPSSRIFTPGHPSDHEMSGMYERIEAKATSWECGGLRRYMPSAPPGGPGAVISRCENASLAWCGFPGAVKRLTPCELRELPRHTARNCAIRPDVRLREPALLRPDCATEARARQWRRPSYAARRLFELT
jgi:hypothetical protein